ncbi:hypothetical protein RvY_08808-1 [Ramazzottius varieornatus]|uniref:Uncharacterized protein n=1 Tax=Ramazzottius varieornatus TaxID=947166 RepID=A0A1D1VBT3_RAMVA|nr:hypothetical protein RvY_08808-1 [Ramazzottius varieornatus]
MLWVAAQPAYVSAMSKMYREFFCPVCRLLELQKQELKKRVLLRARRFARKQYKEFLDQLLKNASGDYNDQEHFVAEVEQWLSAVAVANDSKDLHDKAEADLVNLQHQLSIEIKASLENDEAKVKDLELLKASLHAKITSTEKVLNDLETQQDVDVRRYMDLRSNVRGVYAEACKLQGNEMAETDLTLQQQLQMVKQTLSDTQIINTTTGHVFGKSDKGRKGSTVEEKLDTVTSLIGSGFFRHLPYKVLLKPLPLIRLPMSVQRQSQ